MQSIEKHSDQKDEQRVHIYIYTRFRTRIGFLTSGYKDEYFYWEILIQIKKLIVIMLVVFLGPISPGAQALSVLFVFVLSFVIHLKVNPYYDESLNRLMVLSQFVFIVTIYIGICYHTGVSSDV